MSTMSTRESRKIQRLITKLTEGWGENIRIEAARSLGWLGPDNPDRIVPALTEAMLTDRSESVRLEAVLGIQWIGFKACSAIPDLVRALQKDESEKVRTRIAIVLQRIGCKEAETAVPALISVYRKDKSKEVRKETQTALKKIASELGFENHKKLIKKYSSQKK
ncbi:MAG: hypothetical protein GF308_03715 [Candidatus Heimdallarchaeota archaeon]|nr:hypothetical protein [Candidatus Heimdallarchaeota archaeon]